MIVFRHIIIITLILLLSSCGTISRKLTALQGTDKYPAATSDNETTPHFDISQFKSVQNDSRPFQRKDIAIAIASSGGGYRAANLTAGVMLGLEKIHPKGFKGNLLQETDYFSTVSGSGFPVGLYMSTLKKHIDKHGKHKPYSFDHVINKQGKLARLSVDYSDELFFGRIRSYRLESRIAHTLLMKSSREELHLGDIFIAKNSAQPAELPIWIANATTFQNLSLFPFTPDMLQKYHVIEYTHYGLPYPVLYNKKNPVYGSDMPMSVAATASATFPYAVDGTTFKSDACQPDCYLQLFDGGLIDNLGVTSAMRLLDADEAKLKVLIIVDAFNGDYQPYSLDNIPPRKFDLLSGVITAGATGFRQIFKENLRTIVPSVLCQPDDKKLIIIYLDLAKYPEASAVKTKLWINKTEQAILIKTGMDLVAKNTILNNAIGKIMSDNQNSDKCQTILD